MKAVLSILVVALLLCIVLSSVESDELQCKGERLSDGQFNFNMPYEFPEDIYDCETQWLVDEKVAGISDAEGKKVYIFPIVNLTVNAAVLQTCPERFECLLICPHTNINEKLQCSCDASHPTTLPEASFSNWSVYVYIGVGAFVGLAIILLAVLYLKKQGSGYVLSGQGSAENII